MVAIQDLHIHAPLVIPTCIIFLIVNTLLVVLRLIIRKRADQTLAVDDWLCVAALIFVLGSTATFLGETFTKGLGYDNSIGHPDPNGPDANINFWPTEVLAVPAIGLIKLTFLFLYRRLFTKAAAPTFWWIATVYTWITIAWTICYTILLLFFCGVHPQSYWISSFTEETQCIKTQPAHLSFVISDFIMDIITMLLPWPQLLRLQLPLRKKLGILAILLMGATTCAMSALRMDMYAQLLKVQFDPSVDFEYISTLAAYFTTLELGIGLIAACLPVMYGLIRKHSLRELLGRKNSYAAAAGRTASISHGTSIKTRPREFHLPFKGERLPSEDDQKEAQASHIPFTSAQATFKSTTTGDEGTDIEMNYLSGARL